MWCVASSETCIEILKVVRCLGKTHRGGVARSSSRLGIRIDLHPSSWLWRQHHHHHHHHRTTSPFRIQVRGKKSKATVQLKDLPQGVLRPDHSPLPDWEDDRPAYPTVVQQARTNMRTFSDCVLLTRVGGFYEVCVCVCALMLRGTKILTWLLTKWYQALL